MCASGVQAELGSAGVLMDSSISASADACGVQPQVIRLFGTAPDSIVDGPGLRFAVFVQGCTHHCPGCHNPESQPHEGGVLRSVLDVAEEIFANKADQGVTLSGGEPFEQAPACARLAALLQERGLNVWVYSGYTFEQLQQQAREGRAGVADLLECCDVLVDGPFVQAQKSFALPWRGSANQRLIDLRKTREAGSVVLWQRPRPQFAIPESW